MIGFVSLVGAGPGDPELLTQKAVRRLGEADLVLYDALVGKAVLALARRAHVFYTGKRKGRPDIAQDDLNRLLIRSARAGRRVVRLKQGDPFVFGRGGEEALALQAAGVPFEVVPGISSALAAPLSSGIAVTHRGLASGFVVVSGHAEEAYAPILNGLPPNTATIVVLMGWSERERIAAFLMARGYSPETPAAVSFSATATDGHTWIGTLAALGRASGEAPATITIGRVVTLATQLGQQLHAEARHG